MDQGIRYRLGRRRRRRAAAPRPGRCGRIASATRAGDAGSVGRHAGLSWLGVFALDALQRSRHSHRHSRRVLWVAEQDRQGCAGWLQRHTCEPTATALRVCAQGTQSVRLKTRSATLRCVPSFTVPTQASPRYHPAGASAMARRHPPAALPAGASPTRPALESALALLSGSRRWR